MHIVCTTEHNNTTLLQQQQQLHRTHRPTQIHACIYRGFRFYAAPLLLLESGQQSEMAMRMRCEPSRERDTIIKTIQNKHIYERRTRARVPASLAMRLYKLFLLAPSAQHGRPFICLPACLPGCLSAHLSAFYVRVVVVYWGAAFAVVVCECFTTIEESVFWCGFLEYRKNAREIEEGRRVTHDGAGFTHECTPLNFLCGTTFLLTVRVFFTTHYTEQKTKPGNIEIYWH